MVSAQGQRDPSRKKRRFSLRVVNSGGGILEKEFEFKPSFDEYLKTLESLKEKKKSFKSNKDESTKDIGEKENMSKIVEHDKVNVKSEGATRTRSRKALPLNSEADDVKALRDEHKNFEKPGNLVDKQRASRMQIEERTKESAKLRPVEALNLFHSMREQMASYPDMVAYRSIAVTLGHMRELFDVIEIMRSPPKKKFKTGPLGKWDPRLEPDIVVYNAAERVGGGILSFAAVKATASTAFQYYIWTCNGVLVNTLWKEGRIDEVASVVQSMEKRGIIGSAALYYDLARCLCSVGRCQEALMQIEKICKVASKPLVVPYSGLIQACLDGGSVENGACIFDQMHKYCSPNLVRCNIILKAYLDHGLFDEAKDLLQKMSKAANEMSSRCDALNGVVADSYTFNIIPKRHVRMILEATRAGKGELLETTWERMARADRTPPLPLIEERFCMKLEKNECASAVSRVTAYPASRLQALSNSAWLNLYKYNPSRFQQGTIVGLVEHVEMILGINESPNPVLDNLLAASKILKSGLI
ncbi:Pentatricopeptide repeat-containing protein isoform 2 [Hibiscus syriacus]|uniref:Pentatricopeptide repeat-containing protein isoform 2 n=1 Tax=Hibiscus syriacus TaxID=106335 RepID=A0A6A2XR64_HIBSY|nr:Pentatricopeptide repeat-containing protein isoform 2 [Hibiscus syriacus]